MTFGRGLANFARGNEATAQAVKTRLYLIQDEWFLDLLAGLPWLQKIMKKPGNLPLADALIKRRILEKEGVTSIESFSMRINNETRVISIDAEVRMAESDKPTRITVSI
jgi:hypothetical protein